MSLSNKIAPLILLCLLFSLPASAGGSTEVTGWIIEQNERTCGNLRAELTKGAVRIESLSSGYVILARAPQWQVMIYQPKDKTYIFRSLPLWKAFGLDFRGYSPVQQVRKWPVQVVGPETLLGQKVIAIVGPHGSHVPITAKNAQSKGMFRTCSAMSSELAYYWVSRDIPSEEQQLAVIAGLYYLPDLPGVTLGSSFMTNDNIKHKTLTTSRVYSSRLDCKDFVYPTDFKQMKDIQSVCVSKDKQDLIQDLVDDKEPEIKSHR